MKIRLWPVCDRFVVKIAARIELWSSAVGSSVCKLNTYLFINENFVHTHN